MILVFENLCPNIKTTLFHALVQMSSFKKIVILFRCTTVYSKDSEGTSTVGRSAPLIASGLSRTDRTAKAKTRGGE